MQTKKRTGERLNSLGPNSEDQLQSSTQQKKDPSTSPHIWSLVEGFLMSNGSPSPVPYIFSER